VLIGIEPLIAPQLRAKQLEFVVELADPQLTARADGEKLRQILINLLTNAIKFTPAGGRISVACAAEHDQAIIRVADTGPGIPRDRLATIFDPFVQADRALNRPHDGVGLGLAISRDLARGMGGSLTAESEVGQGAVFSVALPRGKAPQLAPPHSHTAAGA
jgi:signal transduction histidine kinase